ncbi:hypothetical protein [Tenacibaculum sp. 190524A05c]|uniref:tetratricopeptide repeat protein n=1 Tax=Tenacibaculum platacis TaxID=3137852 RepID=UPI0031FB4368
MNKNNLLLVILITLNSFLGFSQTKIDSLQEVLAKTKVEKDRLTILDDLAKEMIRSNHPKQFQYLNDLVNLAKKLGDYDLAASRTRFIAQKYIYGGDQDSAIYVIEEMLKFKPKFTKKKSEAHLLLKRGGAYFNKELLNKAVKDYDRSADLFLESGDSIFAADARFFAGQVYTNLKDFLLAIDRLDESYVLYDKLGDEQYASYSLAELASLYGRNKFFKKAIEERKKVLEQQKQIRDHSGVGITCIQLASNYQSLKEIETAKKYIDSAFIRLDSVTHKIHIARIKTHGAAAYADYYLEKNDLKNAKKYLEIADKEKEFTDAPEYYNTILLLPKAVFYKTIGDYTKAEAVLKSIVARKDKINDVNSYLKAEKQLSDLYAWKGNYKASHNHMQAYLTAKDSLDNEIKTNTFLFYQSQFETERKDNEIYKQESEIALLEKDKALAKSKRNVLWMLLLFVVILSVIISSVIWKQGKLKRVALAAKIEKNKAELEAYTKQLLERSKAQEVLTSEIEKLKDELGAHQSSEKLKDLTAIKILTNEDWYDFKEKFRRVYPNFFASIKNKGFQLTKAEERLIAMEKLYLDTQEIARMLAISQDSVSRSRLRLRKKINAPKGSSLLEYLEAS